MNENDIKRIKEEQHALRESGLPSQQQIDKSREHTKIFKQAEKDYKTLLAFFKKWDQQVGEGDPTRKQYSAAETAYQKALKDLKPFLDSDSNAIITHGTAAQKLYKNIKGTLDGIKWMLYGD
jgi:molecular chaperone GrpE (heat shock protein)